MQHLPATPQRMLERPTSVTSSMDNDYDSRNSKSNFREDVKLSDEDLILIETKDLNKIIKKFNISKARAQEIKQERRTLKNR